MQKPLMVMLVLAGLCVPLFGGLVWQAEITHVSKDDTSVTKSIVYAQNNQVRQEYTEIKGKAQNQMAEKGYWWLYKGSSRTIYIVNPEEKTYFGMNFDSLLNLVGTLGSLMSMKISNAVSTVQTLGNESVLSYDCQHLKIANTYDMEMKVMIMKVKSHVERTRELWATSQLPMEEIARSFWEQSFKTGMSALDSLITREMELYKDIGIILKSVETSVTTDAKGKAAEKSTTIMTVTGIEKKTLDNALFEIPADYKEIKMEFKPGEE